jgi:hypothetical protein
MTPIFTRYLYFKEEVINSLILSIFDKANEESLFWAYELYFSGFQYEVFEILNIIYERCFKEINPYIGLYLNHLINKWDDNRENNLILGDIVNVLLNHKISLTGLMREENNENGTIDNKIINVLYPEELSERDLQKYYTCISTQDVPAIKLLDMVCKYPIRRDCCSEIGLVPFNCKEKYKDNWLYYSRATPLWNERIMEFNGIIDVLTKKIIFEDEEMEEEFQKKYDYEPDEQSLSLKNKIWPFQPYNDISWSDFYKKYGSDCVFRTVKVFSPIRVVR